MLFYVIKCYYVYNVFSAQQEWDYGIAAQKKGPLNTESTNHGQTFKLMNERIRVYIWNED
jgi:hypothetical protein